MTTRRIQLTVLAMIIAVVLVLLAPLAALAHGGEEHGNMPMSGAKTMTLKEAEHAPRTSDKRGATGDMREATGDMREMTEPAPTTTETAIKVIYYVVLGVAALTLIGTVIERPRFIFRRT